MKKVINITIGKVVFYIEEEAYGELQSYLEEIKKYFNSFPDGEDVVEDIETSIAEKFSNKDKRKEKTISSKDIKDVIKAMGRVKDFQDFEKSEPEESKDSEEGIKRLYRNLDDKVLGGVASGIAAFFQIDPVFIRLIFLLSIFFGGLGILFYLVLWLIVPVAKTASQKLEMRGEAVTLSQISKFVEGEVKRIKKSDRGKVKGAVRWPMALLKRFFQLIGSIFKLILPLTRILFGSLLILISAITLIALTVGFTTFLVTVSTASLDPVTEVFVNAFLFTSVWNTIFVFSVYFLIVIPFLSIFLGGFSLLRKKNVFTQNLTAILVFIWFFAFTTVTIVGVNNADDIKMKIDAIDFDLIEESFITKEYADFEAFTEISVEDSGFTVSFIEGEEQRVLIRGAEFLHENLEIRNYQDELVINRKDSFQICFFFCPPQVKGEITITTPALEKISLSGNNTAIVNEFDTENLDLHLSGSSRVITLNLKAQNLNIESSGSSDIKLIGSADTLEIDTSGSSKVSGYEFRAREVIIESSGSSRVNLEIEESLSVESSGSSRVRYMGEKVDVTEEISGSSEIVNVSSEEALIDTDFEEYLREPLERPIEESPELSEI